MNRSPTLAILRRIVVYLKPYMWHYAGAILGIGFANLFINIFMARMFMDYTRGIVASSGETLATATKTMVGATLFLMVLVFVCVVELIGVLTGLQNDLRRALFRKFTDSSLEEIQTQHSGDLMTRSSLALRQVSSMFMGDVQLLMNALLPGIGCAIYMLRLNVRMGVAGILCGVIPLITNLPFANPLRKSGRDVQERQASFTERMSDLLRGSDTVRHLNLARFAAGRADKAGDDLRVSSARQVRLDSARVLLDGVSSLSMTAFVAYVSYLAVQDPVLIPPAIAMGQLTYSVRNLFASIGGVVANIQTNLAGAERILEVLDLHDEPEVTPKPAEAAGAVETEASRTALAVEGLSFKYSRAGQMALSDVSFATPGGRRIALVGPSGSGKSTLVKAILGLYQPQSGEIRAFGKSIYETPLRDWRRLFAYVPQEPFLFAGTIYENILGGMEDPGAERIEQAARLANAHDFIAAMKDGYLSPVGERGSNLSGGQRQRIAIARAILRDAPVLLLDEATASLDTESEVLVQEALDRLMANRTTVVVAHRLSTVRGADEILYMAAGTIQERGSHDELMARGGKYKALVEEGLAGKKPS